MLLTDQPITDAASDELDIVPFVMRLMRPLVEVRGEESLVLGLYGPWGHGKTSALNLLESLFKKEGTTRAVVVRFNPWLYDDTQSLLLSFFGTLQAEIGGGPFLDPKQKESLGAALEGLASFATPFVAFLPHIAGEAVKGTLKGASKLLKSGERDFREKKADVAKVLTSLAKRDQPLRVVVLIDDLDRAGHAEIRAMLKLVKLVADLPNISYVLSMDDRRVRDVLQQDSSESYGAEYLDKIVQVPVQLPPIQSEKLRSLVLKSINEELAIVGASINADEISADGFTRAFDYTSSFGTRIRTLRDRARFINILRFVIRTGERKLDVNPTDLVLLSFLETFYPDVYDAIRRNKEFLTMDEDLMSQIAFSLGDKAKKREYRDGLFRAIAGARKVTKAEGPDKTFQAGSEDITGRILAGLFPKAQLGEPLTAAELREHRLLNRIDVPERFDRYFRLAPPPEEVSDEEVDAKLTELRSSVLENPEHSQALLRGLFSPYRTDSSEAKRESFFEKLSDRFRICQPEELTNIGRPLVALDDLIGSSEVATLVNRIAEVIQSSLMFDALSGEAAADRAESAAADQTEKLFEYEILNLRDPPFAISLADEYSRRLPGLVRVSDPSTKTIANAGLQRARAFFRDHPDAFSEFGAEANGLIWKWARIAEVAVGSTDEVKQYTMNVVTTRPDSLSEVISLCAGWAGRPTFRDSSTPEILTSLEKVTDAAAIRALARERSGSLNGAYPTLIGEFLGRIDRADLPPSDPAATGTDAEQPSAS